MIATAHIWWLLIIAYFLTRLGEWRIHYLNYRFLKEFGAEELISKTMRHYYNLFFYLLPIAVLEQLSKPSYKLSDMQIFGYTSLIAMAVLFRIISIRSLGRIWTMRCLAFPGIYEVKSGPYRFVKNPEYLSRLLEGTCLFLLGGMPMCATVYAMASGFFMTRIAKVEDRQLTEYCSSYANPRQRQIEYT